jgi:hypothetical protein
MPADAADSAKCACCCCITERHLVCTECAKLSAGAIAVARRHVLSAASVVGLKDVVAFYLHLDQTLGQKAARSFLIYPAQVGVRSSEPGNFEYTDALNTIERARYHATESASLPHIYTAFHCYFKTEQYLAILIEARVQVDKAMELVRHEKAAVPGEKRKREEVIYSIRTADYRLRLFESQRAHLVKTIETVRSVIRLREGRA